MANEPVSLNYSWPAIGNEKAVEFLDKSLKNDKLAQTYLFIGPEELGKSTIALAFARNLQGNPEGYNSDLYILNPEAGKKSITIEQVREFIKMLNLSSFMNSYKIGLIKAADLLSEEAKSALLKTLEEPKEKVIIILLVSSEENLPATILSRSQKIYFYPVPAATIYDYLISSYEANRSQAKDLSSLALGRPLRAIRYLENPELYKDYIDKADKFLQILTAPSSDRLNILDGIFIDKTYSKAATDTVLDILGLAEGLLRDLLLLSLDQGAYMQHQVLQDSLAKTLQAVNLNNGARTVFFLERLKLIAQAREYVQANVNPRLVLEQLIFNL